MKKIKRLVYLKLARRLSRGSAGAPVPSIISENTKVQGDIITALCISTAVSKATSAAMSWLSG